MPMALAFGKPWSQRIASRALLSSLRVWSAGSLQLDSEREVKTADLIKFAVAVSRFICRTMALNKRPGLRLHDRSHIRRRAPQPRAAWSSPPGLRDDDSCYRRRWGIGDPGN